MEQIGHLEQAMRDARQIGDVLRNKHNMQPAAIPQANQITGIMETQYVPPPVYSDLTLQELGKQTLSI